MLGEGSRQCGPFTFSLCIEVSPGTEVEQNQGKAIQGLGCLTCDTHITPAGGAPLPEDEPHRTTQQLLQIVSN